MGDKKKFKYRIVEDIQNQEILILIYHSKSKASVIPYSVWEKIQALIIETKK